MKILEYDTEKYCFAKLVSELYEAPLNKLDSNDEKIDLPLGKDTHTLLHKTFYKKLDAENGWPEFETLYISFVEEVIFPMFKDSTLMYQTCPNIRFSRPGAKAVYKWHSDGDKDHKHPLGEINIYLPLTDSVDTNTIWCESIPGLGDFAPINLKYGEYLLGYLNQIRHGNKINETGGTRVSLDFRVVPGFAHDDTYEKTTATTNQVFRVGGYYDKMIRKDKVLDEKL